MCSGAVRVGPRASTDDRFSRTAAASCIYEVKLRDTYATLLLQGTVVRNTYTSKLKPLGRVVALLLCSVANNMTLHHPVVCGEYFTI